MTRTPTLGVAVVALLVAAGGLTGAVAATDATPDATGPAPFAQETTTDDASDDENATDDEAADESADAENASIAFDEQPSNGSAVVVNETTLPEGGFVAVYAEDGSVVGNSTYLEPGEHENVTVELDPEIEDTQVLVGVAHRDTNDDDRFDFDVGEAEAAATTAEAAAEETADEPEVTDGPYLADGLPVTDVAYVVTGDDTLRRNETETEG